MYSTYVYCIVCVSVVRLTSLQAESGTERGALPLELYRHGAGDTTRNTVIRDQSAEPEGILGRSHTRRRTGARAAVASDRCTVHMPITTIVRHRGDN